MTNKEFLKIMFFVHPDRHKDETERRNKATRILLRYRDMMVRKKEREVPENKYKSTRGDLDAMKRAADQKRAARKAAKPTPPTKPKVLR
jgi:hypothetical protein